MPGEEEGQLHSAPPRSRLAPWGRGARLRVVARALVEPAPREDRRVVDGVVDHLGELPLLVHHEEGLVLRVCDADRRAERLGPEEDARLVEPVQPAGVVRIVRSPHEVGAALAGRIPQYRNTTMWNAIRKW